MPSEGQVIQNYQGRYLKVVKVTDSHFGLSAVVGKKEDAENETKAVKFLNEYGMKQIMADTSSQRETETNIEDMKKDELVALAEEKGLDTSGTKDELVERLNAS